MEIIPSSCVVVIMCSVLEHDILKSPFQYSPDYQEYCEEYRDPGKVP